MGATARDSLFTRRQAIAEFRVQQHHAKRSSRARGYEDEECGECGNYTLVRDGTHVKCDTCGATSGDDELSEPTPQEIERM